ncbi:hypothetical protein [Rouxiella sp. WC2420]|uniref:Uncharacterized protein n=1 Tax=Rouxiella sp. WC2420 TaxID=3234145 RepID=A0AB39VL66_9GAMM
MIELQQSVIIERHDEDGWGRRQEFESIWISPHAIESIFFAGLTRIRLISGDVIDVKQTPAEVLILAFGEYYVATSYRSLNKEQPHDQ